MHNSSKLLVAVAGLSFIVLASAPFTAAPGSAAEAPLVVSGYSDARVDSSYGLFSSCGDDLRALLTDTANFGAGGTVERPISLADPGVDSVGPGALDGVDVFFTGWVTTDSYTSDERAALLDYVLGGGAVVATTDDTSHNIADLFGVTLVDSSYAQATPTALASPLIDGPFGTVSTIGFSGNQGIYSPLGDATEVAEGDPDLGPAVALIAPGALGAGSGPVVLVADVDVFTTTANGCASSNAGAVMNSVFVRNAFAYLSDTQAPPVETTTTTAPTTTTTAPTTTTTASTTTTTAAPATAVQATPTFTG